MGVGEGQGGMSWESSTDTHTLPGVTKRARVKDLYSTRSSAPCSVMTLRGGWGAGRRCRREGLYVYI